MSKVSYTVALSPEFSDRTDQDDIINVALQLLPHKKYHIRCTNGPCVVFGWADFKVVAVMAQPKVIVIIKSNDRIDQSLTQGQDTWVRTLKK